MWVCDCLNPSFMLNKAATGAIAILDLNYKENILLNDCKIKFTEEFH